MARELFIPHRFRAHTRALVDHANTIIAEYQAQGFRLTLRQLFYQFVSRDLLENIQKQYRTLQRTLVNWAFFRNPAERLEAAARSYREDPWAGQRYRPEVWIEKEALVGVIEAICHEYRVPYLAHKGGNSASAMYEAGKRFADIISQGQIPLVLHLADHDPTGVFMTEDTEERLALYAGQPIEVRRIALTMEQVRRYRPPANFVKEKDKRTPDYVRRFPHPSVLGARRSEPDRHRQSYPRRGDGVDRAAKAAEGATPGEAQPQAY